MKYKEWLFEWLIVYKKNNIKEKTYQKYQQIITKHLEKGLGEYNLNDLTPIIIQKYITELSERGNLKNGRGLSPNTVEGIIIVIRNSLSMAYNLGLMNESVVNHIVRPRKIEKRVDCFLPSEQKKIEQAVVNDRRDKMIGIIICLYTGIRLGELLALEWKDIDFQKGELTINKTCYDSKDDKGNYIRIIDTPKTPSSFRTVPIPKQIVPLLKRVKQRSNAINVIAEGKKIPSVRSYQRSFELLQKKLNVNHHGFHALRHTFATRAIECGMDVKSLSEILGHKNPTVTLNRYVHSLMTQKKIYMNRLGRLYDSDDFCVMD